MLAATVLMVEGERMSELPDFISFDKVQELMLSLGIDVRDTVHIHFDLDHVEVKQVRKRDGVALAAGDALSTVTTVIGYHRTTPLRDEHAA